MAVYQATLLLTVPTFSSERRPEQARSHEDRCFFKYPIKAT
jgi:hypothetical protein